MDCKSCGKLLINTIEEMANQCKSCYEKDKVKGGNSMLDSLNFLSERIGGKS